MGHAAPTVLLIIGVALAAAIDWRSRRIPNWLVLGLLIIGLGLSAQGLTAVSFTYSLLGIAAGFVLLFPAFALGAMGGGDVKLLAAIGAWCGPVGALAVLLSATVAGGIIAIIQAAQSGKLNALLKNSGLLALNLVHARTVGADHIQQTGKSFRSIDRPLPYAVPLLIGVLAWSVAW